jgi:hypothetical protein
MSAMPPGLDPDQAPVQGEDETDAGWGEPPAPDDDERYHRDRPPHWDSA